MIAPCSGRGQDPRLTSATTKAFGQFQYPTPPLARPGGSQRLFLAEFEEAEEEHHLQLTVQAFRDAQAGRMPAGPGAKSLIEAFAVVDAELREAARTNAKVLEDDAHLESLLRKQASSLHIGPANFCWFRDPSSA
ncbi:hypothetical protein [Streptomyces lunaelactis]|uniref:hypothetical protein n=1 Tax=Streptomyces lunaelactis TaxID=1535768 RepID=UPI0015846401|nr:hypothetical protein [Streptomyces lunaelactis]NUK21971.1 hypothetical protein [Streptomyces lunaelactis]